MYTVDVLLVLSLELTGLDKLFELNANHSTSASRVLGIRSAICHTHPCLVLLERNHTQHETKCA